MFYFTPRKGVLFIFPSRYFSLSVTYEYLVLPGGPGEFIRGFTCPILLGSQTALSQDSTTGLSPSMAQDSAASFLKNFFTYMFGPKTRKIHFSFRLVPFRSPLLWESLLLSFPPATKMFQFTGLSFSSL